MSTIGTNHLTISFKYALPSILILITLGSCDLGNSDNQSRDIIRSTASGLLGEGEPSRPKLLWGPPGYTETITVTNMSNHTETLPSNYVDYRIIIPQTFTNSLEIKGGHNVTIIGGAFDLQAGGGTVALTFSDNGNTSPRIIHVEGVNINVSNAPNGTPGPAHNGDADAIALRAPTAIFQFQNIRVTGVHGTGPDAGDWHGDAIQNQGPDNGLRAGAKEIRIYRASFYTDYQGLMIPPEHGQAEKIGRVDIRFADFHSQNPPTQYTSPNFMVLSDYDAHNDGCSTYPLGFYLEHVYIGPTAFAFGDRGTYPDTQQPNYCHATLVTSGNTGFYHWPNDEDRIGSIYYDPSDTVNFVGPSDAGLYYQSPGYLE